MVRSVLAAVFFAFVPVLVHAQSTSAPLVVRATVVSTCHVDVPRSAHPSTFATMPVTVTCVRGTTPRVQRPAAPYRTQLGDALLIIDF